MITQPFPETGFVRLSVVLTVFPVSRSAWWAGVKSGKYPSPIKLSERTSVWRVEEIRALLESYRPMQSEGNEK